MVDENNKKCEHCGKVIEYDDLKMCLTCKSKQVHGEVTQFLKKLQKAQEATRKHSIYFGPPPEQVDKLDKFRKP